MDLFNELSATVKRQTCSEQELKSAYETNSSKSGFLFTTAAHTLPSKSAKGTNSNPALSLQATIQARENPRDERKASQGSP